mgnify:CR=1 FL=1
MSYYTMPKTATVTKWQRFWLRFLPTYVACEYPTAIFYKLWRGVVYIVGEEQMRPIE